MKLSHCYFALATILACANAPATRAQTELTIAATGQFSAPPDEATATLTVQVQEQTAAKAQAEVNAATEKALALARAIPGLKTTTTGYNTYSVTPENNAPVQFMAQQNLQIIQPATGGMPSVAFSNLLGTLQQNGLLLNSLSGDLSPSGQRHAQQAAIMDALVQIQSQAASIASSLQEHPGVIKSLNVNAAPDQAPRPMMAMAMRDAAPAPQSAPDNVQVTANVAADIELIH